MELLEKCIAEYKRWIENTKDDAETAAQLAALQYDPDELTESFYTGLGFGTSGIRGILGAGPNRLNKYVVRKVSLGLADRILSERDAERAIVIAYDSRRHSYDFAVETANVMASRGIKAKLFPALTPVPVLSYSIDKLGCSYGVMITASHNPAFYNGYKVYGAEGFQVVGDEPELILAMMNGHDFFESLTPDEKLIEVLDSKIQDSFIREVCSFAPRLPDPEIAAGIRIIYTPLNGTGNRFVRDVLAESGFSDVIAVPDQELPDENFTTCKSPNPEKLSAFNEAFRVLDRKKGDIIIATDPDADRVGAALIHNGTKIALTGNQIAVLMLDFLCEMRKHGKNAVIYRSVVSTPMADIIAAKHGIGVKTTLTGFKYIGEAISKMIRKGAADDYFFGFEESNGFLISPFIRDKDGISSSLMIALMAAYQKSQGRDLIDRLGMLGREYMHYHERNRSYMFEGLKGIDTMREIMNRFRAFDVNAANPLCATERIDYADDDTGLPKSDMVEFRTVAGSRIIIRPSGTESKIKVYMYLLDDEVELAERTDEIISSFKLY